MLSAPKNPKASSLPGIANLVVPFDGPSRTASFTDRCGAVRTISFEFMSEPSGQTVTLMVDDGSIASFQQCSPPNETLWYATGLTVQTQGQGIGPALYALLRDLLEPFNHGITPSGNLFKGGMNLWSKMDPSVAFQEQAAMPGYYEPV